MGNKAACVERSAEIYAFLQEKLEGNTQVTLEARHSNSFCFRVSIPTKIAEHKAWNYEHDSRKIKVVKFDGISISVPPDAVGNREGEPVDSFETVLFLGNDLVYASSIGYEYERSFCKQDDLWKEILRVANL